MNSHNLLMPENIEPGLLNLLHCDNLGYIVIILVTL